MFIKFNGIRSAARGRVDWCPARAAAAVSAADPTSGGLARLIQPWHSFASAQQLYQKLYPLMF